MYKVDNIYHKVAYGMPLAHAIALFVAILAINK